MLIFHFLGEMMHSSFITCLSSKWKAHVQEEKILSVDVHNKPLTDNNYDKIKWANFIGESRNRTKTTHTIVIKIADKIYNYAWFRNFPVQMMYTYQEGGNQLKHLV